MQASNVLEREAYIYKIAPASPSPSWPAGDESDQANPVLPSSELDKRSNFIHMSKAAQIPGTLKHFFPSEAGKKNNVWLLKVRISEDLEARKILRWESPDASVCGQRDDEGLFPHLYLSDPVSLSDKDGSHSPRLFLTKGDVQSVFEVVSEPEHSGYETSLQSAAVREWLI